MKKIFMLLFICSLLLTACGSDTEERSTKTIVGANFPSTYVFIEIEGMPCVIVEGFTVSNGISCDWTTWNGNGFEK